LELFFQNFIDMKKYFTPLVVTVCLLFSIKMASAQYCIPNPTDGAQYDTYIDSVSLGSLNFQDTFSPTDTSYSDNTMQYKGQALLSRGASFNLTVKGSPYYSKMHYIAWIDYNNDYDFYDTNEKLGEFVTTSANQVFVIPFTVPSNTGILVTRLRVRCVWDVTNPDPCTDYVFGETEDYTVSITDYLQVPTGINGGALGDVAFFNYNTDNDYDLLLHDDMSSTDPLRFYYNQGGGLIPWDYINGDLPEINNDNLSFNLCDLNNDNNLDAIFTYRYNSDYGRTVHYEKQVNQLSLVNSGFANLKRGSSASADLNNDGRQDVIICGQDDDDVPHTYIYMNSPDGFVMVNDELPGVYGQIIVADYDNDMDIDIFLLGNDKYGNSNADIYRNDNNWKFTNILVNLKKVGWLDKSQFGDFNNDGLLDIVIGDIDETLIYRNNGDDTFSEIYMEIEDWLYDACHWCDMDNDGIMELISQDYYGVIIYKYNGVDSFLIDQKLFVKGENIDIADFDKDNKQDIIVDGYPEISILLNQTSVANSLPSPPTTLNSSVGDLGYYSVTLSWNPGQDDSTPAEGLTYNLRVGTTSGGNDIVSSMTTPADFSLLKPGMGNVYSNTSWYLKNLSPGTYYWSVQSVDNSQLASTFSATQQFEISAPLTESVFNVEGTITSAGAGADFDGDSDIDLIIRDSLLSIHEQISPYNYIYHIVDTRCTPIKITDLNNDNLLDIIALHNRIIPDETYDSLVIYINKGNFKFEQINLDTLSVKTAAPADFDNDGDIDILVNDEGYYMFESVDSLQYNRIKLPFSEILYHSSVSAIDIDRDNDMDFIISGADQNYGGNGYTYTYTNSGEMEFALSQALNPGLGPSRFMVTSSSFIIIPPDIVWNDYNFDGYPDLLITGRDSYENSNNLIYLNDGTGKLGLTTISPRPTNKFSSSWIDFNTDGYLDLIIPKIGFSIEDIIYLNDKNNSYTAFPNNLDSLTSAMYINAIDVDNDYDKDLVYTIKIPTMLNYTSETKIHTNNYNFTNYPPDPPLSITHEIDSFTVILGWDEGVDDLTNGEGMTYNIWVGTEADNPNIISPMSDLQTGYRFVEDIGNVGTNTSWILENLPLGTYYWSVQAIDNTLQGSDWATVRSFEISALTADFSNDTVCLGFETQFTDESVSTDIFDSWFWDFGDGNTSSSQHPAYRFTQSGDNPVKLAVHSGTSIDSITKNVFVKAIPNVDFINNIACDGELTSFTNSTSVNGLSISEWYWDFGDGTGSTFQNPGTHGYLNPNTYNTTLIAVADNGCSDTIEKSVIVGAIPTAAITSSGNPIFCSGDSVVLSVGSDQDYSYQWMLNNTPITNADSNDFTAKLTGNYSVEVINSKGGCITISSQLPVTKQEKPAIPVIVTANYQPEECPGESPVVLSVDQQVAEYSYQWMRNGTPISYATTGSYQGLLPEGDYTVVVDQAGCLTESDVTTLVYDDAPTKPLIYATGPTVWYLVCSNDSADHLYKWYYNGTLIPRAEKYIYVANQRLGKYNVSVGNANGCFTMSDTLRIPTGIIGIEDIDPFAGLIIYPNPTSGIFTIEMDNELFGELIIAIFDQNGKEIRIIKSEKTTGNFSEQVNLSSYTKGLYYISLEINGQVSNKKIIIE